MKQLQIFANNGERHTLTFSASLIPELAVAWEISSAEVQDRVGHLFNSNMVAWSMIHEFEDTTTYFSLVMRRTMDRQGLTDAFSRSLTIPELTVFLYGRLYVQSMPEDQQVIHIQWA